MTSNLLLTKTLFQSGMGCPKRLWWEVHDSNAKELSPDAQAQWMFQQGQEVTNAARDWLPEARAEVTVAAGSLHARVDLMEPLADGSHALIEVKGSNEVKEEHLWDVAFQYHVATLAGIEVTRAELMHLNRHCTHPDLSSLFIRNDVGARVDPLVPEVRDQAARLLDVLHGPLPGESRNATCGDCPFYSRCWPQHRFSVNRFYRMKWRDKLALEESGSNTFTTVPPDKKLSSIQLRQQRSAHVQGLVFEPTLRVALGAWKRPLVYLDFETVAFAIPRFPGTTPWTKIPVQFSAHREEGAGHRHVAFLAADGEDPRRALAASLIDACDGEGSVVTYHSSFEKGCLKGLAEAVPELGQELMRIHERVVDLEPMVAHHLYHPDFNGSFSLKIVLPTLCPDVTYEGLAIADGSTAQLELARMLYGPAPVLADERESLRTDLLAYCERDTWAMVALHHRLIELAASLP